MQPTSPMIAVYGEGTSTTKNSVSKLIGPVCMVNMIFPLGRMLSPKIPLMGRRMVVGQTV
jgi:hypothetical protein